MRTIPLSRSMEALEMANETRCRRAALKRHMRSGSVSLAWVLRANKSYVHTMSVRSLLLSAPKIGESKAERALRALQISPRTKLKDVSMQRREELLEWIKENCPRVKVER